MAFETVIYSYELCQQRKKTTVFLFAHDVTIRMAKIYPPKTLDLGSQAKVYNTLRIDHVFNTLRLDHVLYISKKCCKDGFLIGFLNHE